MDHLEVQFFWCLSEGLNPISRRVGGLRLHNYIGQVFHSEKQGNFFKWLYVSHPLIPNDPILAFPGVDLLQGIGQVLHFSAQGNLIARLNNAIRLGTCLFTPDSKSIGRVIDIFGPTAKPFAAVKLEPHISKKTLPPGSSLFLAKDVKGGVGKRQKK